MNKQNLILNYKIKKVLSLDKMRKIKNDGLAKGQSKTLKVQENSISKAFMSSPVKKPNNQKNNELQRFNEQNLEKLASRMQVKIPNKLRLLNDEEENNKQSFYNIPKGQCFSHELRQVLLKDIPKQMLEKEIIMKNHLNHVIIKSEIFGAVLEKLVCLFLKRQNQENSQELSFLDGSMNRIKEIVDSRNEMEIKLKNKIVKSIQEITVHNFQRYDLQYEQLQIIKLLNTQKIVREQISDLQVKKGEILEVIKEKKKEVEDQNVTIQEQRNRIEGLKLEQSKIQQQVQHIMRLFSHCEKDYENIVNYVDKQSKNKLVKIASDAYKEIESQIYEYAVYLQANELATSYTYESIPMKNQSFVLNNIEKSIKDINRKVMQDNELTLEEKYKLMRDFVLQMNEQHRRKDEEVEKLCEFKTRCIRKFVDMMKKWLDNWTLKQEYLVGLRKEFAVDSRTLLGKFDEVFGGFCNICSHANKPACEEAVVLFGKIEQNYKMGNSFY